MTLQQLEYILAVNQFRHFAKAAEYCREIGRAHV